MRMPLRFARRVRNLEVKSSYYCPTKKKSAAGYLGVGARRDSCSSSSSLSSSSHHHPQICPSCVLPIVVAFIFGFTVIQLIVIHRTIVAYKSRSLAFEEVYGPSHNDTKSQGDLLAFSKKFDSALLPIVTVFNSSRGGGAGAGGSSINSGGSGVVYEWKPTGQSYPYRIPQRHNMNHIWTKGKCPEMSSDLLGNMNISINAKSNMSLDSLIRYNPQVKPGGKWSPQDCSARFHVALIIPYRYRWNHLKLLLSVLHPMLRRQKMSYQVFVAEQFGNYTFNKGLLMNAAFLLALNSSSAFDCVIFHDVDLLPEMDTNIYGCARSPSHLSVSIDAYGYRLPYSKLVGGVFAISVDHFIQVNGYSNLFWGWGGEDDDLYKRLIANQLLLNRPRPDLAKYKMLQHERRVHNKFINPLIRTARLRFPQDGLTTCHFRLVSTTSQALFTHFLVDVGQPSWSLLEPNVHLESLVPPSPSTSSLHNNHRIIISSTTSSSIKHAHSHQNHHHHLHSSTAIRETKPNNGGSSGSRKNNELFMLTGIARDYSKNNHRANKNNKQNDGAPASPARQVRSLKNNILHQSNSQRVSSSTGSLHQSNQQQSQQEPAAGESWFLADHTDNLSQQNTHHHLQQATNNRMENSAGDRNHNEDVPLDPDVPVVQDDEDEEDDDDDLQGDSDSEVM